MNVDMFGNGFWPTHARRGGGGGWKNKCVSCSIMISEKDNTGLHHFPVPGRTTNRWKKKTPLSLQTLYCLVFCMADCLQLILSPTEEICSTILWILSLYLSSKRIYSNWMNALCFWQCSSLYPLESHQNILLSSKCYLFFYTVYLHLRKYPTLDSFKIF